MYIKWKVYATHTHTKESIEEVNLCYFVLNKIHLFLIFKFVVCFLKKKKKKIHVFTHFKTIKNIYQIAERVKKFRFEND
jgi:hypothetical protein